jgi:hypothetical protein
MTTTVPSHRCRDHLDFIGGVRTPYECVVCGRLYSALDLQDWQLADDRAAAKNDDAPNVELAQGDEAQCPACEGDGACFECLGYSGDAGCPECDDTAECSWCDGTGAVDAPEEMADPAEEPF